MEEWEIETKIPIYSDEVISSFRKQLSIMVHPDWVFASDGAVVAKLDELGFTDRLMSEFDKALCHALEPAPLSAYNDFFDRHLRPIDWHAIGMRVGKLYLDSKRRCMVSMSQPNEMKEVNFYKYCPKCVHKDLTEEEDPCESCLLEPVNLHSEKPVCFKEAK